MTAPNPVQAIWDKVPSIQCKGLCHDFCGPVLMSAAELRILEKASGKLFRPSGMACPLLQEGRCSAYEARPLICRIWGTVEKMKCPYGCVPDRWLTDEEGTALLMEMAQAGGQTPQVLVKSVQGATRYIHALKTRVDEIIASRKQQ